MGIQVQTLYRKVGTPISVPHSHDKGNVELGDVFSLLDRQFTSFSFKPAFKDEPLNIEDFNLVVVSIDDKGLSKELYATFEDTTKAYYGVNGQQWYGTKYNANALELRLATDGIDDDTLTDFLYWFRPGMVGELILSEHSNRMIYARVAAAPTIEMTPFEKDLEAYVDGNKIITRVTEYKGFIKLNLVMDYPFWHAIEKCFDLSKMTDEQKELLYKVCYEDRLPLLQLYKILDYIEPTAIEYLDVIFDAVTRDEVAKWIEVNTIFDKKTNSLKYNTTVSYDENDTNHDKGSQTLEDINYDIQNLINLLYNENEPGISETIKSHEELLKKLKRIRDYSEAISKTEVDYYETIKTPDIDKVLFHDLDYFYETPKYDEMGAGMPSNFLEGIECYPIGEKNTKAEIDSGILTDHDFTITLNHYVDDGHEDYDLNSRYHTTDGDCKPSEGANHIFKDPIYGSEYDPRYIMRTKKYNFDSSSYKPTLEQHYVGNKTYRDGDKDIPSDLLEKSILNLKAYYAYRMPDLYLEKRKNIAERVCDIFDLNISDFSYRPDDEGFYIAVAEVKGEEKYVHSSDTGLIVPEVTLKETDLVGKTKLFYGGTAPCYPEIRFDITLDDDSFYDYGGKEIQYSEGPYYFENPLPYGIKLVNNNYTSQKYSYIRIGDEELKFTLPGILSAYNEAVKILLNSERTPEKIKKGEDVPTGAYSDLELDIRQNVVDGYLCPKVIRYVEEIRKDNEDAGLQDYFGAGTHTLYEYDSEGKLKLDENKNPIPVKGKENVSDSEAVIYKLQFFVKQKYSYFIDCRNGICEVTFNGNNEIDSEEKEVIIGEDGKPTETNGQYDYRPLVHEITEPCGDMLMSPYVKLDKRCKMNSEGMMDLTDLIKIESDLIGVGDEKTPVEERINYITNLRIKYNYMYL